MQVLQQVAERKAAKDAQWAAEIAQRREANLDRYVELLRRADTPQEGDAVELDSLMAQLNRTPEQVAEDHRELKRFDELLSDAVQADRVLADHRALGAAIACSGMLRDQLDLLTQVSHQQFILRRLRETSGAADALKRGAKQYPHLFGGAGNVSGRAVDVPRGATIPETRSEPLIGDYAGIEVSRLHGSAPTAPYTALLNRCSEPEWLAFAEAVAQVLILDLVRRLLPHTACAGVERLVTVDDRDHFMAWFKERYPAISATLPTVPVNAAITPAAPPDEPAVTPEPAPTDPILAARKARRPRGE